MGCPTPSRRQPVCLGSLSACCSGPGCLDRDPKCAVLVVPARRSWKPRYWVAEAQVRRSWKPSYWVAEAQPREPHIVYVKFNQRAKFHQCPWGASAAAAAALIPLRRKARASALAAAARGCLPGAMVLSQTGPESVRRAATHASERQLMGAMAETTEAPSTTVPVHKLHFCGCNNTFHRTLGGEV